MRLSRVVQALTLTLTLVGCTDTTGLTGDLNHEPHPKSNPNGAVIVTEFADLQCPSCRSAHTAIVQQLLEKYGAQVRYEFRHFPLQSMHRFALEAAMSAECAGDQEKFWAYVDLVFVNQDKLSRSMLRDQAEALSLDESLFERCVQSKIKRDAIVAEYESGQEAGVRGTPTFFVNGARVETSLAVLGKAIEEAIRGAALRL